jgi:hypothetical protein
MSSAAEYGLTAHGASSYEYPTALRELTSRALAVPLAISVKSSRG